MAIRKISKIIGRIDCPNCFSLIEWDSKEDVYVSNGTEYVICPECGQHIILNKDTDYWIAVEDSDDDDEGEGGDTPGTRKAVVGTAIVGQDKVSEENGGE